MSRPDRHTLIELLEAALPPLELLAANLQEPWSLDVRQLHQRIQETLKAEVESVD